MVHTRNKVRAEKLICQYLASRLTYNNGMRDRVLWLTLGIALGAAGSFILSSSLRDIEQSPASPSQVIPQSADSETESIRSVSRAEEDLDVSNQGDHAGREKEAEGTTRASRIPPVYSDVIGRPRPKRFNVADRHAIFLTEPRDEAWAGAMESGINNFLADNSLALNVFVEHVECRSEHCEVAGYTPFGLESDMSELKNGLKNTGWWQGGVSSASTSRTIDGVDRFVVVFNRNSVWTAE